jgi:hypothetical protein
MPYYIICIICFVYCVVYNWMPVATHRHEPSEERKGVINGEVRMSDECFRTNSSACSFGWWLLLICSKRKVLLVG